MTRNIGTIIIKINKYCDNLDFASARKLIESNLDRLSSPRNYHSLNDNAKVLIKHIVQDGHNDVTKALTRTEMFKIEAINKYCQNFDISMLKRELKDSTDFIMRDDVQKLLYENTKFILTAMGALITSERNEIN